jgi:hypothetical protein
MGGTRVASTGGGWLVAGFLGAPTPDVLGQEGLGKCLCLGRLRAEPECHWVAAFNPVTLSTLDVLVGPHAVVERHVGVVRAVSDEGRIALS